MIGSAAETADRFNERPNEPDDVRLEFTFDSRLESNGAAGTLYRTMANLPEWVETGIFDTKIVFEGGQEPRLEMADLLAREAMKELKRKITNTPRPTRRSRLELDETKKFKFVEHDRAYCERWRAMVDHPESHCTLKDYHQWLSDTGRVQNGRLHDNPTNRFLFFTWLGNRDALRKKRGADSSRV